MIETLEKLSKEELISELITEKSSRESLQINLSKVEAELSQLRRMIFGSKSERFVPAQPVNQATLEL